jgi:hypothetical protein
MAYDQDKPYAGEFPCESAAELDDQAVEIIVRNLQAGRSTDGHSEGWDERDDREAFIREVFADF